MNIDEKRYTESIVSAIGDLAIEWRGCIHVDVAKAEIIKQRYCELLTLLLSWQWNGWLEPDDELPEKDMPQQYIDHYNSFMK